MGDNMQDRDKPLRFYKGDENGVVIEHGDYENSIFRNQYTQALKLIEELAFRTNVEKDAHRPNIIAFCGDRGEGKTSCMRTVQEIIKNADLEVIKKLLDAEPAINMKKLEFLKMIEPAFFDNEHNILELVLGQLFGNFKECEKKRKEEGKVETEKQKELLKLFNRVKKCATLLETGGANLYDSIEELDELAASMTLRDCIDKLLEAYLEYSENETLVVVIDDMDYNWHEAYDMTKLLSKYLSGERCIVMVSVSIKQLIDVTKTSFINDLQHKDTTISFDGIAAKYINKLIPLHYRVEMPKIQDMSDRKLEIADRNAPIGTAPLEFESVKHGVVQLIFDKTRYLFYNSVLNASLIVPNDLRSLRHLLGLLLSMKDYDKTSQDPIVKTRNQENKRIFQSYLYNTWTQQLRKEDRDFVLKLVQNDQSTVNKLVVQYLKNKIDKETQEKSYYKAILSSANYAYNISIGDVFYVLDYIERNAVDRESKLLVFFLKSYYSIMMYSYYDMITEDIKALHPTKQVDETKVFKFDSWFYTANYMQSIVNGSYFTYGPKSYLVTELENEDSASDLFCIDGKMMNDFLGQLKEDKDKYIQNDRGLDRAGFKKRFRLAELMILYISRMSYTTGEYEEEIERARPNPFFAESFNTSVKHYVFDVLAPFVNLINIKFTYDRYSAIFKDMYQFAKQNDWSLLRKLMRSMVDEQDENKDNLDHQELRLVSDAVLRNAEILTMVKEKLESMDNVMLESDDSNLIAVFYESMLKNMNIRTYELIGEKYKKIEYKFLSVIAEELKEADQAQLHDIMFAYSISKINASRLQQMQV